MIPKWWCIIVAFSAFMIQVITWGIAGSIGLYNIEFLEYFDVDMAEVSLVGSINIGFFLGAGPIVSLFIKRFSHRMVCVVGSVLSTVGIFCIPFTNNIIYLYILLGAVTGSGFAMTYVASSVIAGLYFDKHRSLATGFVTSGTGLGTLVFPILIHYLIDYYGWKGSMIILAGLQFHCVVFSALLFPLKQKDTSTEMITINISPSDNETQLLQRPDNYSYNISDDEGKKMLNDSDFSKKYSVPAEVRKKSWNTCYIFLNLPFTIYFINNVLWNIGVLITWILGPEYYLTMGFTKGDAATLVTIAGFGCFLGCIIGGGLGNIKCVNRLYMYIAWNIINGAFTIIMPWKLIQIFEILSAVLFISGLAFGGILGLLLVLTVDLLDEDSLGDGFGYLMLSNGLGSIIGPPLGGLLKDSLGTFDLTFYLSGGLVVFGGLLMSIIPIKDQFETKRAQLGK